MRLRLKLRTPLIVLTTVAAVVAIQTVFPHLRDLASQRQGWFNAAYSLHIAAPVPFIVVSVLGIKWAMECRDLNSTTRRLILCALIVGIAWYLVAGPLLRHVVHTLFSEAPLHGRLDVLNSFVSWLVHALCWLLMILAYLRQAEQANVSLGSKVATSNRSTMRFQFQLLTAFLMLTTVAAVVGTKLGFLRLMGLNSSNRDWIDVGALTLYTWIDMPYYIVCALGIKWVLERRSTNATAKHLVLCALILNIAWHLVGGPLMGYALRVSTSDISLLILFVSLESFVASSIQALCLILMILACLRQAQATNSSP